MTAPLTTVPDALARARRGAGATVLIAGRAGSGLSHAIASAATLATQSGMTLARAAGRPAERPLHFGVAVELLTGFTHELDAEVGRGPGAPAAGLLSPSATTDVTADGGLAIIRSIWTLARRAPGGLAMIVDDLHDVDAPTLRLLAYGAARLAEWPIALIAAHRIGAGCVEPAALAAIGRGSATVAPTPLDGADAAALVRRTLPDASPQLCAACVLATGANPGLLVALATDLSAVRAPTAELDPGRVGRSAGAAVIAVLDERLARLPEPARRLARVLAAHEGPISATQIVAEVGVHPDEAAVAIDALVADGLLVDDARLTFAQPILRAALRISLSLGQRLRPAMTTTPTAPTALPRIVARSPRVPAASPPVEALTPSESRVAELAAKGMTTREIAATLFVTPKTVEFHLRNVYRKLEIPSSRSDLARALAVVPPPDERPPPTIFTTP